MATSDTCFLCHRKSSSFPPPRLPQWRFGLQKKFDPVPFSFSFLSSFQTLKILYQPKSRIFNSCTSQSGTGSLLNLAFHRNLTHLMSVDSFSYLIFVTVKWIKYVMLRESFLFLIHSFGIKYSNSPGL